ncbi:hypothetical protein, partial [Bacteroides finegoldii]|uniref:hypothetical protein n=1 Tax=Bacteroides finegoldii TaxID=338188 RepID=UPI002665154F
YSHKSERLCRFKLFRCISRGIQPMRIPLAKAYSQNNNVPFMFYNKALIYENEKDFSSFINPVAYTYSGFDSTDRNL